MSAILSMTGGGGWPMNVWLTPDRKPYFGGSFFPARDGDRGAPTGFLTLLKKLKEAYQAEPAQVAASSNKLVDVINETLSSGERGNALPDAQVFRNVVQIYKSRFDKHSGGLSYAPKFPSQTPIRLLLRYYRRTGDQEVLTIATYTLRA